MQDTQLTCKDCGSSFTWTAGEQEFYKQKGFTNPPTRCPNCRQAKKAQMQGGMGGGMRQDFPITCSNCGKSDTVPFKPTGDKPVLCRDCFKAQKRG
jgi:CxxC-x17-CxxC domain-containing protein